MTGELEKQVLKGVSRSFYLTLRLLPKPMRGAASLGYLLARTSDTLADRAGAPDRLGSLDRFATAVAGHGEAPRWPAAVLNSLADPRERILLERSAEILSWLESLRAAETALVREVVGIIISGQRLDLERFATATRENAVTLRDDAELEDYAWRVAGCVGAFWTKLGFLTLGGEFSEMPRDRLLERGIAYGKGLQLVNILRDVAEDLANGRCYLPGEMAESHARWRLRAEDWIAQGESYAASLRLRRLRAATVLPALIARKTLGLLRETPREGMQTRVKIPRGEVYRSLLRALTMGQAK